MSRPTFKEAWDTAVAYVAPGILCQRDQIFMEQMARAVRALLANASEPDASLLLARWRVPGKATADDLKALFQESLDCVEVLQLTRRGASDVHPRTLHADALGLQAIVLKIAAAKDRTGSSQLNELFKAADRIRSAAQAARDAMEPEA